MFAAIRIRGSIKVKKEINDTLDMLRLRRINHCIVVPETSHNLGMLKKVKDYIAFGKVDKKIIMKLFKERGMLKGRKKLTENELKKITKIKDFENFSDELLKSKIKLRDFPEIKPVFRLNPPRKGFKSTRLPYPKGDLGNRKEKINELIERMI